MDQRATHFIILFASIIINGIGCLILIKKNFYKYGIILLASLLLSSILCLAFYWLGFYRFALPVLVVLPGVAISFTCLALFSIKYRPAKRTFPFFFMVTTWIFTIEVLLKNVWGFIVFRNGWDYWTSYSLYWVYIRIFDQFGELILPDKIRSPIKSDTKRYWFLFFITIIYAIIEVLVLRYKLYQRI